MPQAIPSRLLVVFLCHRNEGQKDVWINGSKIINSVPCPSCKQPQGKWCITIQPRAETAVGSPTTIHTKRGQAYKLKQKLTKEKTIMQPAARRSTNEDSKAQSSSRNKMIAAIHIKFRKVRRDLRYAGDAEIREERLAFITHALKLRRPLDSMRGLSDRQLGIVLNALKNYETQPSLPNSKATPAPKAESEGAEIFHLDSAEQAHTIHKLLDEIGWDLEVRENFIMKRFKRKGPAMLSQAQAQKCTTVLLFIAAQRAVRSRTGASRVTRLMVKAEIPNLKKRLGIDQKPALSGDDEEVDS